MSGPAGIPAGIPAGATVKVKVPIGHGAVGGWGGVPAGHRRPARAPVERWIYRIVVEADPHKAVGGRTQLTFLLRRAALDRLETLRRRGCAAHLEEAEVGQWRRCG